MVAFWCLTGTALAWFAVFAWRAKASLGDLELGTCMTEPEAAFFTVSQATKIMEASPEPYRTLFAVDWSTGLRAGELLALTVADLDFSAQDNSCEQIRRRQHAGNPTTQNEELLGFASDAVRLGGHAEELP